MKKQLEKKVETIDAKEINQIEIGKPEGAEESIYVRVGKFGPFLQYGEKRASVPEDLAPDELKIEKALEIINQTAQAEEPLGICPETGKPVFVKVGRFGPYVQRGTSEDEEKPQYSSLLK